MGKIYVDLSKPPPDGNVETCRYLRTLGRRHRPTDERIGLVESFLSSKHHNVRCVAIKVLGRWKSRRSLPLFIARLKAIFKGKYIGDQGGSCGELTALTEWMPRLVVQDDTDEFVDWFLSLADKDQFYSVQSCLCRLDQKKIADRFEQSWPTAVRELKYAMLRAIDYASGQHLLTLALNDGDPFIKEFAETQTAQRDLNEWENKWIWKTG